MKKVARVLLGVLVSAIMLLQFPIYAHAGGPYYIEDGDISVHATDSDQKVRQGGQEYVDSDPVITNRGTAASDNHVSITADAGSTAYVTISDVSIASSVAAIQTAGNGSVEIKLVGRNHVTSGDTYAGIEKGNNGSLTISSDSSNAYLEATGGNRGAGIGGHDDQNVDDIIITGGNITAYGGQDAAGIGGGYGGDGTGITISGGYVHVLGGSEGAGIGGGRDGSGSDITITGGTVVAEVVGTGAGIGGGRDGSGSDITITGGTVTAEAVGTGAGIGGGDYGSGSDITITGGTVVAYGSEGAGIGGGRNGNGNNIKITGGNVTANGRGTAAGIGGGIEGNGTEIFITGGNVYATGVYGGAGIGGGRQGNGANITISGGTVMSVSNECGAGIGGGRNGNGADISVSNSAKVMVAGGEYVSSGVDYHGAGIGSGMQSGTDIINGEEVNPNISRLYDSVVISYYPPGTTIDDIRMGNVRPIRTLSGLLHPNGETDDDSYDEDADDTPESNYFDDLTVMLEIAKEAGGPQTIYWSEGTALPGPVMKFLLENPQITLVFSYTYEGLDYTVTIPGKYVKYDPNVPWCGPLYLYGLYGRYGTSAPVSSTTLSGDRTYTVISGETLWGIARRLGTTVDELVRLNNITNPDRINIGQIIRY